MDNENENTNTGGTDIPQTTDAPTNDENKTSDDSSEVKSDEEATTPSSG